MTNAEAIAEAKRIEESIEARIAAGEIPPRPEGYDRDAHSTWFTKHLVCAEPTHRYFVRERGHALCRECLGFVAVLPSMFRVEVQLPPSFSFPHIDTTITTPVTPAKQARIPRKLR